MQKGSPMTNRFYISFSAEIIPHTTETLIAATANVIEKGADEIYLLISTQGGNVHNGIQLYNTLRALPAVLITHNVGNVDSIGNAIFLAGDKRFSCPHSTFMFHGVGYDMPGPVRLEAKMLRERLDGIDADERRISNIIQERTNLDKRQARKLFRETRTKDVDFALEHGIIHEICDVNIPSGSPIVSLVFQR